MLSKTQVKQKLNLCVEQNCVPNPKPRTPQAMQQLAGALRAGRGCEEDVYEAGVWEIKAAKASSARQ